jgi:hypothetical protein
VNRSRSWQGWSLVGSAALVMGLVAGPASAAVSGGGAAPRVCSGTLAAPGVLSGSYEHGAVIKGICFVNGGVATIEGNLTLTPGSGLDATFANNDLAGKGNSRLVVWGNVVVGDDVTLIAGCLPTSSPCSDDPNAHTAPTLSMAPFIHGSMIENAPLGVIMHDAWIGGSVTQLGGGGGFTCNPLGVFKAFGSPVFSTYEDSTIVGSLLIANVHSCWLGTARAHIGGNADYLNNSLADPDAIEIVSNNVQGDLVCSHNSMVWDSGDLSTTGSLFPRAPQPNTVHGDRIGQCVLNSPTSATDKPGPGKF